METMHALLTWIWQPPLKSARAGLHVPQLLWNPILSQLPPHSGAISYASGHNLYDFEAVMGLIFLGWNKFQPECQRKGTWLKLTSLLVHFQTMLRTLSWAVKEPWRISGSNAEDLSSSSFVQKQRFLQTRSIFAAFDEGFPARPAK